MLKCLRKCNCKCNLCWIVVVLVPAYIKRWSRLLNKYKIRRNFARKEIKELGQFKNGSTLSWLRSLSYRNQSYDRDLRYERVDSKALLKCVHELTTGNCLEVSFPGVRKNTFHKRMCSDLTKKETFNNMRPS